jgi:hypothetical protein
MFYWMNPAQQAEFESALQTIMRIYPRYFAMDMLITVARNMGFLSDAKFVSAVAAEATNEQERSLAWRLHVLCWSATNALKLHGDFVECGVYRGFSSAVVARYTDFARQQRTWYLYDTFAGVPEDQRNKGHGRNPDYESPDLYDLAVGRFSTYPNVRVVRGRVPEVLAGVSPARIAFLHLDLNSATAELGTLECLYDRIVPGGQIVLDDYGWYPFREQQEVEDRFFRARGVSVLELPTGQGLVIKPPA